MFWIYIRRNVLLKQNFILVIQRVLEKWLIIDHITVLNTDFLERIRKAVKNEIIQFILVESGFTTCAHKPVNWQLDKKDFNQIWFGQLKVMKKPAFMEKAKKFIPCFQGTSSWPQG